MRYWLASERGAHFVLLLGIGLVLLFAVLEWRFPSEQQLQTASGRLEWERSTIDSYYFGLQGEERMFVLYRKGDPEQKLQAALHDAVAYPARVSFDPQQRGGAMLLSGQFYPVYGVSVGGKPVLPLETVRGYYRHDNLVALGLGLLFLLAGGWRSYQCATAIKRYPLDQLD
ncbi:hypothetical protein ACFFKC_10435 [Pseudoduganella danionis]|uniref:DUF3592 domain-containing protein n=1 Tax=Pseudoduganella danionis TaxID=1890295 RepID=A0ABW9SKN6_9BURK|nr:hypothetical protein [Pseudoduganella danionis]MTW32560.1 hypothetical protein [Pseudoduganella danionis]